MTRPRADAGDRNMTAKPEAFPLGETPPAAANGSQQSHGEPKAAQAERKQDGELKAIAAVLRILEKLPDEASRRRVVCYVNDRWQDERDE